MGNWAHVQTSIKAYEKLVGGADSGGRSSLSTAHSSQALAAAYAATVRAEVAFRRKHNVDDARKHLARALEACPTYTVRVFGVVV